MTSYALVQEKPGTTKTTSAVLLAASLHDMGRRVLLVDCDPGKSAQRWPDLAGGFPFAFAALAKRTVLRDLRALVARMDVEDIVIDTPQMEDHDVIAHGVMGFADRWIVPVAPAGIEVDRMGQVARHMELVDATRETVADRVVLLTRTNRSRPTRTGPDADVRDALKRLGWDVLSTQVPLVDSLYRQTFGTEVDFTSDTAYPAVVAELMARPMPKEL